MEGGPTKERKRDNWFPSPPESLKFIVDSTARGKPGPAGIEGVLQNQKGEVLFLFPKHVRIRGSYKA